MKRTAHNIHWVIDMDDAFEKLDEMTYKDAADAIGVSDELYANMTTEERHDYAFDLFHHCPGALADFMELPETVDIPNSLEENEIANWISEEYGFYIDGFTFQ